MALGDAPAITVTVTSPDGSRERVYRVLLGQEEAAAPALSAAEFAARWGENARRERALRGSE